MMQSKAKIKNKMYDVCTLEQYTQNPNQYLEGHTAIVEGDHLYPVLNSTQFGPGVRVNRGSISYFTHPKEDDPDYQKENAIDFNEVKDIASMIDRLEAVKKIEGEVLTSPDNIFTTKILPGDTPEMTALKTAINKKQIDLDKYSYRFGANYNNDKRLLNKSTISLGMMKRIGNALDLDISLKISDTPDAPNPMGEEIEIKLTGYESEGES
ncbi:MAG: hypothetical protein PHC62_00100 [Candidatus Izemoplasmatales bacterium]|nr:hypothetical protein [Candidatus Izemoplasmatales bacterium]